jgi:hypothetical protein
MSQPMPNHIHLEFPPADSPETISLPSIITTHPSSADSKTCTCPIPTRSCKARKKIPHNAHQTQRTRPTTAGTRQQPTPFEEQCRHKSDSMKLQPRHQSHETPIFPTRAHDLYHQTTPSSRPTPLDISPRERHSRRLNSSLSCPRL